MKKEINLTKEEIWHIVEVMKEREIGHCVFCEELLKKLKKYLDEE